MTTVVSVTANGALAQFDDIAGWAVAFYRCIQSLIVSIVGTLAVTLLNGDRAWPVICCGMMMAVLVPPDLELVRSREVSANRQSSDRRLAGRLAPTRRTRHRSVVN